MMDLSTLLYKLQREEGLLKTLGIELEVGDEDFVTSYLTIVDSHMGAPGIAHGGVLMSLLDSALGFHALGMGLKVNKSTSTVELKTNFLRPAPIGQRLVVRPEVQSQGRSLLVISGAAVDVETGARVAFAVGTFNLFNPQHLGALR